MSTATEPLEALRDIKRMMERSSRFISLSGWSGISAGICALIGAMMAVQKIAAYKNSYARNPGENSYTPSGHEGLARELLIIAAGVFVAAFVLAFLFTYWRSKKQGIEIWGHSAWRLLWNTVLPMLAGGFVLLKMYTEGYYLMLAPCCLIFYGLALVNGSKYTLGEVRYLGYGQIILGLFNLLALHYGLVFWMAGFGVLHILYGAIMWWKYEKSSSPERQG